jgi:hypothetical protein
LQLATKRLLPHAPLAPKLVETRSLSGCQTKVLHGPFFEGGEVALRLFDARLEHHIVMVVGPDLLFLPIDIEIVNPRVWPVCRT